MVGVQQQDHGVVLQQVCVAARELRGRTLGIEYPERHVDVRGIIEHERFGAEIGRLAEPGLELNEVSGQSGIAPLEVPYFPVDRRSGVRWDRPHDEHGIRRHALRWALRHALRCAGREQSEGEKWEQGVDHG